MPSKTFIVRAHARTVHTRPVTFVCAKCQQMTTRDCWPGTPPKYCLKCSPRKKRPAHDTRPPARGDFVPTHKLVDKSGKVTPVALEKSPEKDWFFVRTALDWFSGESIIRFHFRKGLESQGKKLEGYELEPQ